MVLTNLYFSVRRILKEIVNYSYEDTFKVLLILLKAASEVIKEFLKAAVF
jgi:hypothetical protein